MHALIVEGPAGWGKTTAVDEAMKMAGVSGVHLGAYSTPLHLFNFLHEHSKRFVVIDDCAGLFNDQSSMAILKAATWGQAKGRLIRWGSTSSKAATDEFLFVGKLVIICNSFPISPDAEAVRSRSFPCRIEVSTTRAKDLLERAARDKTWYSDTDKAKAVAKFLCARLTSGSLNQMSYRTLQMGYELAQHNANQWQNLLEGMIVAAPEDPKKLIRKLARQDLKVKDQARIFEESTGLKRRTFFKYRRELNVSRS
ncbi:MAG: hypothetical protein KF865_06540 [Bdellovibrionaceae bacterium]|nr:hypothetical protein [Pseudobdellovibrionaceae bacterium]